MEQCNKDFGCLSQFSRQQKSALASIATATRNGTADVIHSEENTDHNISAFSMAKGKADSARTDDAQSRRDRAHAIGVARWGKAEMEGNRVGFRRKLGLGLKSIFGKNINVLRLDVAMDDSPPVEEPDSSQNLSHDSLNKALGIAVDVREKR